MLTISKVLHGAIEAVADEQDKIENKSSMSGCQWLKWV
jgi:hypothetical protein